MMLGRTWTSWQRAALVIVLGAGLAACGDDDGRPPATDAGSIDGGGGGGDTDAGGGGDTDGGGGGDTDAGTTPMCSVPGGECDLLEQMCPDPTHSCQLLGTEEGVRTLCQPSGTVGDGEPCTTYTECAPGFTCDMESMRCRKYCCGGLSSTCPAGTGQICISFRDAPNVGICVPPAGCTLVPQGGCPDGQGCYQISADGATDCRSIPADALPVGGDCSGDGARCVPGAACFTSSGDGSSTCRQLCRNGMDADCTSGGTCMSAGGLPSGIGACLPGA